MGLGFLFKRPKLLMAGHPTSNPKKKKICQERKKTHGKGKKKWPKIPSEEKPRERVLPNPIPES